MSDQSPSAGRAGPLQTLSAREFAVPWVAVGAIAGAAWMITIALARSMGTGPGTMGLSLLPFLALWLVMMAAMMLPSVAPVGVLWTHLITSTATGPARVGRTTMFFGGYLIAWTAIGAICFAALTGTERLLTSSPTAAKWVGVAILIGAGAYQLTPWKAWCLRACRSPIGALVHYLGFTDRARDLRVGLHHGITCVGCCWALMIVLVAVGVMNLPAMAALAGVVFVEKLWRFGKPFGYAIGFALIAAGFLAIWFPWLLPGLTAPSIPMM